MLCPSMILGIIEARLWIKKQLTKIKENLFDLAQIQLEEGKRQMHISQQAVNTVAIFTQIGIFTFRRGVLQNALSIRKQT